MAFDDAILRNWTSRDDPNPGEIRAPDHYGASADPLMAIAAALGLGPAYRGEWSGRSQEVDSPWYGTGKGSRTPIADVLGMIPWPAEGAMAATGIIPRALAAAKSRAELAASNIPSYTAIGKALQDAPGIAENAWNLGKEAVGWLGDKLAPAAEETMEAAAPASTSAAPYRSILHKLLGNHDVVIPYIPRSADEALTLKTGAPLINDMLRQIGIKDNSPMLGLFKALGGGSDLIASTLDEQTTTLPHEFSHRLQDLLTGIYSAGTRPEAQEINALAKYGWPIREQFPGWKPLDPEALTGGMPGQAYNQQARQLWDRFPLADQMRQQWSYGADAPRMANEVVAELANPKALATRFYRPTWSAEALKADASYDYPALKRFWEYLPETIPEKAYDVPQWSNQFLGGAGQATAKYLTSQGR